MVKKIICNICYKQISIFSLKNHIKLHGLNKIDINCFFCNKKLSSNSYYKHYKNHQLKNEKDTINKKKEEKQENLEMNRKNYEKVFYICKKKIFTNMTKDEVVEELNKSILQLEYYKNLILNNKVSIIKDKENKFEHEKYLYKFIKAKEDNKTKYNNLK